MDIKDYFPSKTTQGTFALTLTESKQLNGLISDPRAVMAQHNSETAFVVGMPIQKALKANGRDVRLLLLAELERLVRAVGATRTFQNQDDLQTAIDDIIELFPSLKLEEFLLAFKMIRQGRFQLYSTFTTTSLIQCLREYEMQNTVPMRERQHELNKRKVETASLDVQRLIKDLRRDGKLGNRRKTLDRFVPIPNELTTYDEIEKWRAQHMPQKETIEESAEDGTPNDN